MWFWILLFSLFAAPAASYNDPDPDEFEAEGNIEFLRDPEKVKHGFAKVQDATISEVKAFLCSHGLNCRPLRAEAPNA